MSAQKTPSSKAGAHHPAQDAYKVTALVLQGGGALGAYQAGVYQALAESGLHPNWIAGISIGALNAAIIAGNAPEHRVEQVDRVLGNHLQVGVLAEPPGDAMDGQR